MVDWEEIVVCWKFVVVCVVVGVGWFKDGLWWWVEECLIFGVFLLICDRIGVCGG